MFVFLMFRVSKTIKFLIFFYLFFNVFLLISQANEDDLLHNIVQYESPKPISSVVFEDFSGNDVNLSDYTVVLSLLIFGQHGVLLVKKKCLHWTGFIRTTI